jgi:chromate transporter
MVLAISWAYVAYGGLPWMQAVFYGVGPCVIGIIAISAYKLTKKTIGRDPLLWLIYLTCVAVTVITESEWIALFLLAGVTTWLVKRPPKRLNAATAPMLGAIPLLTSSPGISTAGASLLWKLTWFFTKAGAFVFGSGLAILPFLYSGVVKEYGWLNDQQFLDAVAVAMITPGPVVITVAFIGFLVAGLSGAVLAALGTFIPCYLFTVVPAPYFKKHGKRPGIVAFVDGVTAAAVGAIAGAVIVLARRMLFGDSAMPDVSKLVFLTVTLAVLLRYKKLPEPVVVLCAALAGLLLYPLVKS